MPVQSRRFAPVVLAILLSSGCALALPPSDPHPLLLSTPAARSEQTLASTHVSLPEPGHVTVVDVWGTSCVPCVRMMPALEALSQRERAAGVRVVGVAVDDNPGVVQQTLRERGVTYPNVVDAGGEVRGWLRTGDKLPFTVVFDARGRVRWVHAGSREGHEAEDMEKLSRAVRALVSQGDGS